jgi:hypothetical protein
MNPCVSLNPPAKDEFLKKKQSFPPICKKAGTFHGRRSSSATPHYARRAKPRPWRTEMKKLLIAATGLSLAFAAPYALAQDTVVVPDTVTTYVTQQQIEDTTIDGDIAVGTALPDTVVVKNVPDNDEFGYAFVNKKRVIVEPKTRKVIRVVE